MQVHSVYQMKTVGLDFVMVSDMYIDRVSLLKPSTQVMVSTF